MVNQQDRRVRKTRKSIEDALFSLMDEIPYQKIRISQITDFADISRSTFYHHYETKDDVLLRIVDEIIDEYFQAIDEVIHGGEKSPTKILFHKWGQNINRMRLILDAGMEYRIYQRLRDFNSRRTYRDETDNPLLNDYIRTMLDGACFALLLQWTKDNASVPAKHMIELFNGLNINALFQSMNEELSEFGVRNG